MRFSGPYFGEYRLHRKNYIIIKGNCHEMRMHLSKFVCGNMPGFLVTFRSRNLLFCLEWSLSPPKARHMRVVFALHRCHLESNLKSSGCLFQVNCSWQLPFKLRFLNYFKLLLIILRKRSRPLLIMSIFESRITSSTHTNIGSKYNLIEL